jgi:hypothetical protein
LTTASFSAIFTEVLNLEAMMLKMLRQLIEFIRNHDPDSDLSRELFAYGMGHTAQAEMRMNAPDGLGG